MRRPEFQITNETILNKLLDETMVGILGLIDTEGFPYTVPLNFVRVGDKLYFHGSHKGKKMESLEKNPNVSFTVIKEHAYIPSYFSDPDLACPATQFFESLFIQGIAEKVDDLTEKSQALQALMEKHQPEGQHIPVTPDESRYESRVKSTALIRITIRNMTGKAKLGQHLNEERYAKIQQNLQDRNAEADLDTLSQMKTYRNP